MTMLDAMRRHKGILKWSLAIVCLAFVIFYSPAFLGGGPGAASGDVVASVDGHAITVGEFRRIYQQQLRRYREQHISEQMLKQLGIDRQLLQQMVEQEAELAEAARQGITATDEEVRQAITSMPGLQVNGRFIGEAAYRQALRMQGMTPDEFEEDVRRSLVLTKLRGAVTNWLTVPASEVEQEFRRRNEKVKLDVIVFPIDKYRSEVTVTDPEVGAYFDAHKDQYRVGEKRKVRYLLVDADALRAKSVVSRSEIERYYNNNVELYSTPEEVRASHILFKTEGKDEAAVKAKAEEVLKEARAGADFAELATKYSEDEASAKNGGDLDYFPRGRMVPEFDQVAFSLEPGQISDLVKTQYGFHIIKLTDKKSASNRTLDEVRQQVSDQLAWEKAQAKAEGLASKLEREVKRPSDLDRAAKENGLTVQQSGLFTRDEPIMGLGPSPEAAAEAFDLADGQVSGAVHVSRGYVFLTVTGKQAPYIPKLADAGDRVREDVVKEKAKELARQKAAAAEAALKSAPDFAKAAKAAGLDVKTTEPIARESAIPDLGVSPQVDTVAFSLPVGAVSDPIVTDNACAIVRVVEHTVPTRAEFANAKAQIEEELLGQRRGMFFTAYMGKARERMKIEVNRDTLQRVVG
jgi:peptidyl-prolyl cis-trans isomerase D